jgi:outer membrane translocation and assembly module TamA
MARYDNARLGTDRVRLQFEFDSYHEQWNNATLASLPPALPEAGALALTSAPCRTRQDFAPAVVFSLTDSATVTTGVSFERFRNAYPDLHTEAANALDAAVRYDREWEGSGTGQDFGAGYDLRAATRVFSSDYVYARHRWNFRYTLTHGRHMLRDEALAGVISGRAPLDDRFFLGNSRTLRGWSKFGLDPLGGNRMVHNSVEYRYSVFEIFYDAGTVWDEGRTAAIPRHGLGAGLRHGPFELALAFPVRNGRADPTLIVDMNY